MVFYTRQTPVVLQEAKRRSATGRARDTLLWLIFQGADLADGAGLRSDLALVVARHQFDRVAGLMDAIDHVITHELCHIAVPHHGPEFFDLLRVVLPDWQQQKDRLECVLS